MLLIELLKTRQPPSILSMPQWDIAIRQARSANLLSRLASILKEHPEYDRIPYRVREHFASSLKQSDRQHTQVLWELKLLSKALGEIQVRPILLKGAAYHYKSASVSKGRTLTDIDILVHKSELNKVQRHLFIYGWIQEPLDDYDEKYYRQYTHEIPPLINVHRSTTLDVHHNIFPVLRGLNPEAGLLWSKAEFDEWNIGVLHPYDQIIHSATHLFWEGEFENGLRDLTDLDILIGDLGKNGPPGLTLEGLASRSEELGLSIPLFFAFRYCNLILKSNYEIPAGLDNLLPGWQSSFYDSLFTRVLIPFHPSAIEAGFAWAKLLLLLRGHLIKMPLNILIPHTLRKVWVAMKKLIVPQKQATS